MNLIHPDGRDGRLVYLAKAVVVGITLGWAMLVLLGPWMEEVSVLSTFAPPDPGQDNPVLARDIAAPSTGVILAIVILAITNLTLSVLFMIRRLNDLGRSRFAVLLTFVPIVNLFFSLYLIFAPGTPKRAPVNYRERFLPAPVVASDAQIPFNAFDPWQPSSAPTTSLPLLPLPSLEDSSQQF